MRYKCVPWSVHCVVNELRAANDDFEDLSSK